MRYPPEGVSQVAVDDPVIQMFLLIQKFTDLVAGGGDGEKTNTAVKPQNVVTLTYNLTYRLLVLLLPLLFYRELTKVSG